MMSYLVRNTYVLRNLFTYICTLSIGKFQFKFEFTNTNMNLINVNLFTFKLLKMSFKSCLTDCFVRKIAGNLAWSLWHWEKTYICINVKLNQSIDYTKFISKFITFQIVIKTEYTGVVCKEREFSTFLNIYENH